MTTLFNSYSSFFKNSLSEAWVYFVQCQTSHFNKSVIKIQTQLNTAREVNNEVSNLKSSLQARRDVGFVGIMTKRMLNELEREGDVTKQQAEDLVNRAAEFYDTCISEHSRLNMICHIANCSVCVGGAWTNAPIERIISFPRYVERLQNTACGWNFEIDAYR